MGDNETASVVAIESAAVVLDRYSRLSTDLANERTLLAWVRTGLAAMRTVFTFFPLMDTAVLGARDTSIAAQCVMMLVCVLAAFSGYMRYVKIKVATFMPIPPKEFGRQSVKFFYGVFMFVVLGVAMGVWSLSWD